MVINICLKSKTFKPKKKRSKSNKKNENDEHYIKYSITPTQVQIVSRNYITQESFIIDYDEIFKLY